MTPPPATLQLADPVFAPATAVELSVVLPVYNEEGNLRELHERLSRVCDDLALSAELVFVDDGSSDGSFQVLRSLHEQDPRTRVIRLARNFGQQVALSAGLDAARGELVTLMDSDLQDQPEALPTLLRKLDEGFDVVRGLRMDKRHSLFKRATSFGFNWLLRRLVPRFEVDSAVFRVARRPVIDAVRACREQDRYVWGLFGWVGFRQTSVPVPHGRRQSGASKFTLVPMLRLARSAVRSLSVLPLQLATWLGVSLLLLALATCIAWFTQLGSPPVVQVGLGIAAVVFACSGLQLFCLGIFGSYLGQSYQALQGRPLYVVSTTLESGRAD